jgi:hypothetical protein
VKQEQMMFELFMEDGNSDEFKTFLNLMRRKYAVQMRATSIPDVGKQPVEGQLNSTDAVPFYVVTALRGPPIPNVITLVAMNAIRIAEKMIWLPLCLAHFLYQHSDCSLHFRKATSHFEM